MSVADTLTITIAFGSLILLLIDVIVRIVVTLLDSQKDRR